jgi:hypothetical protein
LVRILTRKTTMNCQNHKVYPIQAERPERAHNLNCWACETILGIYNIEMLEHALQSCPCLTDIRKDTLGLLGLYCSFPQPTPPAHSILWGQYYRLSSYDKLCDFLGNLLNNQITSEILKIRNKKWSNSTNFVNNIKKLLCFNQNVRSPE